MDTRLSIKHFGMLAAWVIGLFSLMSCNGMIYNDEGDCSVYYRLKFRYDMNLKFADAFAHEVKSVRLFAFDTNGKLVWQTSEQGSVLASENYSMELDLAPGDYRLVAWCGLDNEESFSLPDYAPGCRIEDLHCKLNRRYVMEEDPETGTQRQVALSDENLHPLFYGTLDVNLPVNEDGGEYTYVMPLIKDTNVFRVVLQQLSGEDLNADDFTFTIEDRNGWMAHDNSLRDNELITYRPWATYSGEAGVETTTRADADTRVITNVKAAVAELTVGRLIMRDWEQYSRPMLVIRKAKEDKRLIASIPIIDYALLVKGAANMTMDNQEYLDRADEYNIILLLEANRWVSIELNILSWRVVIQNTDLNS